MKKLLTKQNFKRFLAGLWDETARYLYVLLFSVFGAISLAVLTGNPEFEDFLIDLLSQNFIMFMLLIGFAYGVIELVQVIGTAINKEKTVDANATVETI